MTDAGSVSGHSQGTSSFDVSSVGSGSHGSGLGASSVAGLSNADATGNGLSTRTSLGDHIFSYTSATTRFAFEFSWKLQALIFAYQHFILFVYALHPIWGFDIHWSGTLGRWALRLQGHGWAMMYGGVTVLDGLVLCAVALTCTHAALATHLWFVGRRNKASFYGETQAVRFLEVVFFKLLGIPVLGVMLAPLTCDWSGNITGIAGRNLFVRDLACSDPRLSILGCVALVVALLVHIPLYLIVHLKECELNPITVLPLPSGSFLAGLRIQSLLVASLVILHLLVGVHATLAGTLISLLWVWIAYIHLVRMPFIGHLHCAFRNGVAASLCWIFIMATAQTTGTQATVVAAAGAPLAFVAVAGLSLLRARWAYKVSERFFGLKATLAASAKRVHKFWDCEEPEMLVRMIRRGNQQLAPEIIQGCGIAIVHAGTHFVDSPQVVMALAALQAFLENDIHAANSSVQKARGMTLSLPLRIAVLTLEKELRKRKNAENGDSLDWASYVDLQNSLKILLQTHRKAVQASRDSWKVIIKHDVGLDDVIKAIRRIERADWVANEAYRSMLERHPRNSKLLQMYAKFLEEVQANTGLAHQYYQEAEKLEDSAAAKGEANDGEDLESGAAAGTTSIDEHRDAVVVINTEGVITFTNSHLCKIFGYKRGDLNGRNVASLMPPPFCQQHDRFVKNYVMTGVPKILNRTRKVVALSHDRSVLAVQLCVTKISQAGRDAFMGVMRKIEEDPRVAKCYVTPQGHVLSVSKAFTTMMGYTGDEVVGQPLDTAFMNEAQVMELMQRAIRGGEGAVVTEMARVVSKFGEEFEADLSTEVAGSEAARIVVISVKRRGEERAAAVVDARGAFIAANVLLERLTGFSEAVLKDMSVTDLFPEPLRTLHGEKVKERGDGVAARVLYLHGRVMELALDNGATALARISVIAKRVARDASAAALASNDAMMYFDVLSPADFLLQTAIEVEVAQDGTIAAARTLPAAFGYAEGDLLGQDLSAVLDSAERGIPLVAAIAKHRQASPLPMPVPVIARGGILTAAVMEVMPGPRLSLRLSRIDAMCIVAEVDEALTVLSLSGPVTPLTGYAPDALVGKPLLDLLPRLDLPSPTLSGMLDSGLPKSGGIRKAQRLGRSHLNVDLQCRDRTYKANVQAVENREAGTRGFVMIEALGHPIPGPFGSGQIVHTGNVDLGAQLALPGSPRGLTSPRSLVRQATGPRRPLSVRRGSLDGAAGAAAAAAAVGGAATPLPGVEGAESGDAEVHAEGAVVATQPRTGSGHGSPSHVAFQDPQATEDKPATHDQPSGDRASPAAPALDSSAALPLHMRLSERSPTPARAPMPAGIVDAAAAAGDGSDGAEDSRRSEERSSQRSFAYSRMRDWVDSGGSPHPADGFAEAEGGALEAQPLRAAAISKLQGHLEGRLQGRVASRMALRDAVVKEGEGSVFDSTRPAMASRHDNKTGDAPKSALRATLIDGTLAAAADSRHADRPVDASERHAGIEATLHAKTSKKDSTASAETADNADATAEQRQETAIAAADAQGGGDANAAPTNEGGCEEADVVALQLPPALRRPKRLSFAKRATGNTEATSALPTPSSPRMGKDAAPLDFAGTLSAPKRYGKDLGASHPVSPRRASNATVPVTGRKSSEVAPASDMESNAGDRTAGQYRLAMSGQDKDGGEYDSHDLLQQDDVQVKARKFKRIHALLTTGVMHRPQVLLKYALWVVVAVIAASHSVGYAVTSSVMRHHYVMLNHVNLCSANMKGSMDIVRAARVMQAMAVGVAVPGYSYDIAVQELQARTTSFLANHNALYTATSKYPGKWGSTFHSLWLDNDMKVTEMTSSDLNTSTLTQSQRNLWEVGNVFASQAFLLAKVTAEQAASADVAQDSTFRYLMDNGDTPLNQRYTQVLDALIGRAKWNLHTMGVSALVFLAVEVGVVVPAAIWVLKARLTGVLAVRVRQIAFLVAVPRGVLVELARRSIELEDVEGVDDGETGAADREADKEVAMARDRMGEARLSSKAMRALLAQKLDYERVCVARDQILARRPKQKSHRSLELRIITPFLIWAAVVALLFGLTWLLQTISARRLEPMRAMSNQNNFAAKVLYHSTQLVVETINQRNGSPYAIMDTSIDRSELKATADDMESIGLSMIWGDPQLLGKYDMPSGTVFRSKQLLAIYFDAFCFKTNGNCSGDVDSLDEPSLDRGLFALTSRYMDEVRLLSDDDVIDLTDTNSRYQFIMSHGVEELANALTMVEAIIKKDQQILASIEVIHVLLLVATLVMSLSCIIVVLRPLDHILAVESNYLAMLCSELPRELGVEDLITAARNEMARTQDERDDRGDGAMMERGEEGGEKGGVTGKHDGQDAGNDSAADK